VAWLRSPRDFVETPAFCSNLNLTLSVLDAGRWLFFNLVGTCSTFWKSKHMNGALAGLVILMIGDSHIATNGFFNNTLHDALVAQGAIVHSFGACNSTAKDWMNTFTSFPCGGGERHNGGMPQLVSGQATRPWAVAALMEKYKPGLVIVELGDTLAGYPWAPQLPRDWINPQVSGLTQTIAAHQLPCIWVGPPWGSEGGAYHKTFTRVREVSDYLAHSVAPCKFIDSLRFSRPGEWPTQDGVHLTVNSYSIWAGNVASALIPMAQDVRKH
jgi:hypothetical protein